MCIRDRYQRRVRDNQRRAQQQKGSTATAIARSRREVEFNVSESALTVSALRGEAVGVQFHITREDYAEQDDAKLGIPTATDDDGSSCCSTKGCGGGAKSRLYTVGFELFDPADEE
eukprot:TRINITY_DN44227_c0_g1_i1.p1 TRINITY_DN44227_c0_g1~~TRINITY_DN44227_c0_g1_i1.p1  ORF type:complete len:116 (-),score=36.17 TRINITY_DN44227_c0_g1_i1:110-457(-)